MLITKDDNIGSGAIRVLLIEDNPGDSRLITEMLSEVKGFSFDLKYATSLSKGIKSLIEGEFDVVLLDLGLSDSLGLETFSKIYAHAWDVPIVVLSGLDDEEVAVKAMQTGAQDYLVKGDVDSRMVSRVIRYAIERKRIEEAMKTSEANYRAIFDAANDAILVHDIETGDIIDVNRKGCEMFCYTKQELCKLKLYDLGSDTQPHNRKHLEEWMRKADKEEPQLFEWLARDKANRAFWVEINLKRTVIGGVSRLLAVMRDITERKQAQQDLESQKDYYEKLLDDANIWIEVLDKDGRVILWNKKAEEATGYKKKDVIGSTRKWELQYPDAAYRKKVFEYTTRTIAEGKPVKNVETEITTANGSKRIISWSSDIIYNRDGAVVGGMFIGTDVTDDVWRESVKNSGKKHKKNSAKKKK